MSRENAAEATSLRLMSDPLRSVLSLRRTTGFWPLPVGPEK